MKNKALGHKEIITTPLIFMPTSLCELLNIIVKPSATANYLLNSQQVDISRLMMNRTACGLLHICKIISIYLYFQILDKIFNHSCLQQVWRQL